MADYKTIKGVKVQTYSTDPDNPIEGQVWYDNTAQTLQYQVPNKNAAGSWRTGNNMNTGRGQVSGSGTAQTAALAFLGYTDGSYTPSNICESYDGTSWTEIADLNTARRSAGGTGTSTSSIAFGGLTGIPGIKALAESWNGSAWSEVADLNTARYAASGFGADNTSALYFGGSTPPDSRMGQVETWNGSSWTETTDLNTHRSDPTGNGTLTSGLAYGGQADPAATVNTESWNGSAWTEVANLNTARQTSDHGMGSDNTSALCASGDGNTNVELWNGTAWAETTDVSTARTTGNAAGTATAGLIFGGHATVSATEEWAGALTLDVNAWATGTSVNSVRYGGATSGTHTAALLAGGVNDTAKVAVTETWNGSSWTEVGDLNTARADIGS